MKLKTMTQALSPANSAHLDFVRSVATLAVVCEHILRLYFSDQQNTGSWLVQLTGIASRIAGESVMVFFVLSGFFIAGIVRRTLGRWTWNRFLIDRLSRLYVVLLPALLFTALIDVLTSHTAGAWFYLGKPLVPFLDSPIADHHTLAMFFGNLGFLQLVTVPAFGSDLPLWSLSSEFWYYMIFPCMCLVFSGGSRTRKIASAIVVLGFVVIFPHRMVKYFAIWLFGAAVNWAPTLCLGKLLRRVTLFASTAAMLMVLFAPYSQHASKWTLDCSFSLAFSVWLFALVRMEHSVGKVNEAYRGFAAGLAACSYSVYVTHFPLLLLFKSSGGTATWQITPATAGCSIFLLMLVVSFGWLFARSTEAHTGSVRGWLIRCTGTETVRKPAQDAAIA